MQSRGSLIEILTSEYHDLLHLYSLPCEKIVRSNGVLKTEELTANCIISFMLEQTVCLISNDVGM